MQVTTLSDAPGRGQKLRYVTTHFRDLQGLRMAPFWGALLILTCLGKSSSFSSVHLAWAAVLLVLTEFGWLHVSGRWYEQRYGVVKGPEPPVRSGLISIMHPEVSPSRASNRYYGYYSGPWAVFLLIWALSLLPSIFLRHRDLDVFTILVTTYQILPRCVYPVTNDWPILLRRILASAALITMIAFYIDYRFAQVDLWTWMAVLLSVLLLLDLYDHWLLNHLLSEGSTEWSHE